MTTVIQLNHRSVEGYSKKKGGGVSMPEQDARIIAYYAVVEVEKTVPVGLEESDNESDEDEQDD